MHSILPGDSRCSRIIKASQDCFRRNHYKTDNEVNFNPLFNYRQRNFPMDLDTNTRKVSIVSTNSMLTYGMSSDGDEEEDQFNASELEYPQSDLRQQFIQSIMDFRTFLSTTWGGSKSPESIQMDIANIREIFHHIGENKIWNSEDLNTFFTTQDKRGLSPITIHAKLRSLRRYIDYLNVSHKFLLPNSQNLGILDSLLKGVEKSLLRKRKLAMKNLMGKKRRNYEHTISVMKHWRSLRSIENHLQLIDDLAENTENFINRQKFESIRNYFIAELIIPNGQRAGIISGIRIEEVENAQNSITSEGYHKIMIADHKTGHLQSATIFVYHEVFVRLYIFVTNIIPRIPSYYGNQLVYDSSTHVFIGYSGNPITSSEVTPLLRKSLKAMGITYKGTVTDFRRAAATLTAQYAPEMAENMALFLGHSRRVYDKHYRIQLRHSRNYANSLDICNDESLEFHPSSQSDIPSKVHNPSHIPTENDSSCFSYTPTHLTTNSNRDYSVSYTDVIPEVQVPNLSLGRSISHSSDSFKIFTSSVNESVSPFAKDANFCFIPAANSTPTLYRGKNQTIFEHMIIRREESPVSKRTRSIKGPSILNISKAKTVFDGEMCQVSIEPFIIGNIPSVSQYLNSHPKSIFHLRDDEQLFVSVFSDFIHDISRRVRVTRRCILERAFGDATLAPLLSGETVHNILIGTFA